MDQSLLSPKEAVGAAKSFGVFLDGHQSKRIDHVMTESFDMIVVLKAQHLNTLRKLFQRFKNKFFLLPLLEINTINRNRSFIPYNILDPYRKDL